MQHCTVSEECVLSTEKSVKRVDLMLSVLTKIQDGRQMGPNGEKPIGGGRRRDQEQRPWRKEIELVSS